MVLILTRKVCRLVRDKISQFLRKALKCRLPEEKCKRSKLFLHLEYKFVTTLKRLSGFRLRTMRKVLQRAALSLDDIIDNIQKIRNPLCFHPYDEQTAGELNIILDACTIPRPFPFNFIFGEQENMQLRKIAEGSYGQVYAIKRAGQEARIVKVAVAYGFHHDNPDSFIETDEVIADAVCSRLLSSLRSNGVYQAPNFPLAHKIYLADGKHPKAFVDAWYDYETSDLADDDSDREEKRPEAYSMYTLYLVMELENCGRSITDENMLTPKEAMSVFLQTASALAVAEEAFEFEHRDLHGGNLLVRPTDSERLSYRTSHSTWRVETKGISAFIIDFSLSRITAGDFDIAVDMSRLDYDSGVGELDFSDHTTLYAMMDEKMNGNSMNFAPETNIVWLRHITEVLCEKAEYMIETEDLEDIGSEDVYVYHLLQLVKWRILPHKSVMAFFRKEVLGVASFGSFIS